MLSPLALCLAKNYALCIVHYALVYGYQEDG